MPVRIWLQLLIVVPPSHFVVFTLSLHEGVSIEWRQAEVAVNLRPDLLETYIVNPMLNPT